MKNKGAIWSVILTAILCISSTVVAYSGGSGATDDPYQISTVEDWQELMASPDDWHDSFILINDLDLAGQDLMPVGNEDTGIYFSGSLDGGGFAIHNATITLSSGASVGLLGRVDSAGHISNLTVESAAMTGYYGTGALVGVNSGTVSHCHATGNVTSNNYAGVLVGYNGGTINHSDSNGSASGTFGVGGLVGYNEFGSISDCSTAGVVFGTNSVGGMVGENDFGAATITSCYATGSVSGSYLYVGGLVGRNQGTLSSCFWDTQTSGLKTSDGGTGKTTAEMMTQSTFTDAGWDFTDTDGNPPVWKIQENTTYPHLFWESTPQPHYTDGSGTMDDPYQISTVVDWQLLMASPDDWNQYFIQTADLDMQGIEMTPVGNVDNSFTGSFDGQGYRISNANMYMPFSMNVGVFGYVSSSAYLSNIHLESVYVTGYSEVGGLIGLNDYCTVNNCYVMGVVNGWGSFVGGLIGLNSADTTNSYSTASVSGLYYVGGLIGRNDNTLENCHASGSVSAGSSSQCVGGLVGLNYGSLTNCYATGSTNGETQVGGLIGLSISANIDRSYASGVVGGVTDVGGLIGSINIGNINNCYAAGAVTGGVASQNVGGLVGNNQATIYTSYSMGLVSGVSNVGGLIGISSGTANTCFWDTQTSGLTDGVGNLNPDPSGVTGLDTATMMTLATFSSAGWDFNGVWRIRDGYGYPQLVWQSLIPGDIAGSPAVDLADLMAVAEQWMLACTACPADVNGDGVVNMLDFVILGGSWLSQP